LQIEFRQAAVDVKSKLKTRPNNDELLLLYGFFKQAIQGDNTTGNYP
jgi:acyl-CoA-binding protein